MRSRLAAVAATACALALLPAAYAVAGPEPEPDKQQTAHASTAAGNPLSARARAAGVCSDAYEIGTRGVIRRDGEPVASVKQFYSPDCDENYGYVWVWESFRSTHSEYDVSVAVKSYDTNKVHGQRHWDDTNAQEFWSVGVPTATECTSGFGELWASSGDPKPTVAHSSARC